MHVTQSKSVDGPADHTDNAVYQVINRLRITISGKWR